MEGLSIAAIARLTGLSWNTVSRWLERAAQIAQAYNHDRLRHFELTELQADEMRTFAPAKKRPTWIYTTREVWSRLWPVTRVGRRGYRATLAVLRDLSDRALPGSVPLIGTDGYRYFKPAVRKVFGSFCVFGQVIKTRRKDLGDGCTRSLVRGCMRKARLVERGPTLAPSRPTRKSMFTLLPALLSLAAAVPAAQDLQFQKLLDTKTALPGGPLEWNSFGFPSIHNGRVAFQAFERGGAGGTYLYTVAASSGPFALVCDTFTPMPHSGQPFRYFWNPALRGNEVLFDGSSHHQWDEGIYHTPVLGGPLQVVFDPATVTGSFHFGTWDGAWVAVAEGDASNPHTIWVSPGSGLGSIAASAGQASPSGDPFLEFRAPVAEGGHIVFPGKLNRGTLGVAWGIYSWDCAQATLSTVADFQTPIPSGAGTFEVLLEPDTDGIEVSFQGVQGIPGFGGQNGVYFGSPAGSFERVADLTTGVPGGGGSFTSFGATAIDDGLVLFEGSSSSSSGVYGQVRGGPLFALLQSGDLLGGGTVRSVFMSAEGLHRSHAALLVDFTDNTRALYSVRMLTLRSLAPLVGGMTGTLRAAGLEPGELVHFLASRAGTGTGPCSPRLGGLCLDLLAPIRRVGSAIAASDGAAETTFPVPASVRGLTVHFQAVVQRGPANQNSAKSNFISLLVL